MSMMILATIVVLGVLIFVHELGHFLAAKAVDIEVQRFSIGLGPKVWGMTYGETEYVLSAIPLGGYVKMGGMADEVMDRIEGGAVEGERRPGPRDFDGKPIWARTLVISAGVIMNFLFAWLMYSTTLAVWGERQPDYDTVGEVVEEWLPAGSEGLASLNPGDRLLRIGEAEVSHWGDVRRAFLEGESGPTRVEIEGRPAVEFRLPVSEEERVLAYTSVQYWIDPRVGGIEQGSAAEEGGVEAGDLVRAVDGQPVASWYDFVDMIEPRAGRRTELLLERDGGEIVRYVTPRATEDSDPVTGETSTVGRVGIRPPPDEVVHDAVPFTAAVVGGLEQTVGVTGFILAFLRDLVMGGVSPREVGSIVTIGAASGQAASMGLEPFLLFLALFSVNLAVLNLLPIPILDGGHLLFLAIEAVRGKALSIEQRLRWSNVGFLIVMGIMIWALSNDVLRLLGL
jgi:regulator of sigma E protease